MSFTKKCREFTAEPMREKPVNKVPGVGTTVAKRLKNLGYPKAKDLYNVMKRLGVDEKMFKSWMTNHCPGAHAVPVYKALKAYHDNFGDDFGLGPSTSQATRTNTPRRSVQFNIPETEDTTEEPPVQQRPQHQPPQQQPRHPLVQFFLSCEGTVEKIPSNLHIEFMQDILKVLKNYERKSNTVIPIEDDEE